MRNFSHYPGERRLWFNGIMVVVTTIMLAFLLAGCGERSKQPTYTIGFSQCTLVNQWRQNMLDAMQREVSFHPELRFIYRDAGGSTSKQIAHIRELADLGVDLLVVSPNEAEPITPIIEQAHARGVKVIIVDRKTSSDKYTAYVGASNYEVGATAAGFANSVLKGKGKVLEVSDIPGSSADIERHKGFTDELQHFPGIRFAEKLYEQGDEQPSNENVMRYLQVNPDIQLIFAQNDRLALSAYNACRQLGLQHQVAIIGVDGLIGDNGGINLVENGMLSGTILYPTGGEEAILTALDVLNHKPYKKENLLTTSIIDSSNVRIMKLQAEKMLSQQKNIDRSQRIIEEQTAITRSQSTALYAISILLLMALILGGLAYYYLRENRKINRMLGSQNTEILDQQRRLIEMSARAKEATEARFNFFTNISHEFRTPLTLILGPLEELLGNPKMQEAGKNHLQMIRRNVMRLLKMVNQLIDFRKIELDKMEVNASSNDLVNFTREIVEAFGNNAAKRDIDLRFFTSEYVLEAWFDVHMLDKVLYNLVSNALKFTGNDGYVHVSVQKSGDGKYATIHVKDNGVGMDKEAASHAFDLFYQAGHEAHRGSGIGLSLSKELVQLHHGKIDLVSEPGKGTIFTLQLLLGKDHFHPGELSADTGTSMAARQETAALYTVDLPSAEGPVAAANATSGYEYCIAVIEDNADLLNFMAVRLGKQYHIVQADNGLDAIRTVFEELPDLIISDIMIPGKDGLELTGIFKNDVRTAHIPVILLTAKAAAGQQIEGYSQLADAYISKPFNVEVLENNIKSLLLNRHKMKEHYSAENPLDPQKQVTKKSDRKFAVEFAAIVEANIGNEKFRVDDICNQMGISRVQLYRKVKALMHMNVNEYILNTRMQKAKYYLQHEHLSVSEVAWKAGFSSASYFSTVFKAKFDVSPKEIRNPGAQQYNTE